MIITVKDDEAALAILNQNQELQIICEDALLVHIHDELGALAGLAQRFSAADIKIRSIRFVERHNGHALVAIATERTQEALALVEDILVS